ncbi:DUF6541 family protein [Saccharothrix variisporea]|uniref:Uncharacterized protein n=1 Tax=Saccharothrix variisporea TaxID=543527 RepID=A0A495XBK7_9PSEU|nr:DUF6541 family protein [Saccharothrix variisporea]RKT71377.1 hypothetical protein DFJ66_4666 [Saccharothrix variisporea]
MIALVLLAFWVPGLALGLALRLRGWTLAAAAPALTFGMVALAVVVLPRVGVKWTIPTALGWAALLVALAAVATWLVHRRAPQAAEVEAERPTTREHVLVGVGVALGAGWALFTYMRGITTVQSVSQDWDAPYHGGAVRRIAEVGNLSPADLAVLANTPGKAGYFYPNTYHSLLATVFDTGWVDMAALLNYGVMAALVAWPLGIAAFGLAWRLPPLGVAVAALVSTWFGPFPYDLLWRGPLWPYVAGLALVPAALALLREVLDGRRGIGAPVALALTTAGLVGLHTSLAFVLAIYGVMLLVALLVRLERVDWRAARFPLLLTAVLAVLFAVPVVLPALSNVGGITGAEWPELFKPFPALRQALVFSAADPTPFWWTGFAALAGTVVLLLRRRLVWVVAAWAVFVLMFVSAAAKVLPFLSVLTGPFYNDAWRIAALYPLLGAVAIGELAHFLGTRVAALAGSRLNRPWAPAALPVATAVVLVAVMFAGSGGNLATNRSRLAWHLGGGDVVSQDEVAAYRWLGERVQPGEVVANDVRDGGVWMYPLYGVTPLNYTYYGLPENSDGWWLEQNLNKLDTDPKVRETVERLHVRYVLYGEGLVQRKGKRSDGMVDLDSVRHLRKVFQNPGAVVYEVLPDGTASS